MKDTYFFQNLEWRVYGMAGYNEQTNKIVVTFRGVNPPINWAECFLFALKKTSLCENCKVHYGILRNYHSIRDQVMAGVKALVAKYPNADRVVTGHSMGAGLGALCALDII